MPDWTWQPEGEDAEVEAALDALAAEPEVVPELPEWLGGPGPGELEAPAIEPPGLEAAPEAVAPVEGELEPDPLAGTVVAQFPWEVAEPSAALEPAPVEVDALSGAEPAPVADPMVDPLAPQEADASYTPEGAERYRVAQLDDVALAEERARADEAWRAREADLKERYLEQDRKRREENEKLAADVRDEARAELESIKLEAAELAQTEVDPGRWFANASTSQKIGAGISAVIGGLLSPHNNGRNTGIEFIQGLIEQDIAAQRDNLRGRRDALDTRRGLVGDLVDLGMAEARAAEVARQAAWQAIDLELAVEQQKYEQGGTTFLRVEGFKRAAIAAAQKAAAEAEEKTFQRNLAIRQDQRADAELAERRAANLRAHRRAEADRKWEQDKYALDKQAADSAAQAAADDKLREEAEKRGLGGLRQADGRPFLVGSTEERSKLASKQAKTASASVIINRLLRAREEHGWTPGLFRSDDYQEALADWGALNMSAKDIEELGVIAGADLELIKNVFGGAAGPGMRDPRAGLRRARDNWVSSYNEQLRARGYTGPDWSPAATLYDKQEAAEYRDQMAREEYGATQGELAAEYERIVADSEAAGVAPESIAAFKTRKRREHKALQKSIDEQAERARKADRESDTYDQRPRQQR